MILCCLLCWIIQGYNSDKFYCLHSGCWWLKTQINVCPSGYVNGLKGAPLKCWHEQICPQNHQSGIWKIFPLLYQNTKQYIFQCKNVWQCVVVITYTTKRGSDSQFKLRDAKLDIQGRRTHKHCCFCLDIHRVLNLAFPGNPQLRHRLRLCPDSLLSRPEFHHACLHIHECVL